ncbi:MAG: DUF4397 domain-containing protein [Anaerolineae bacterium]|nr:DUF4397 domain-containing protein [Anaerolineae bacterium]
MSRLVLVHALSGGANLDVQLAESIAVGDATFDAGFAIAADMAYGASFGSFDLPAQTYVVNVVPTGTTTPVISEVPLALTTGTSQMAIVYGTTDNPQTMVLAAPTAAGGDAGFIRFVHGVVGAAPVDVYINDTLAVPMLGTNNPTVHIAAPAGNHSIELRVGDDVIASTSITVEVGNAQTVVALADGDGIAISVFADDFSGVSEGSAVASVINTITEAATSVELSGGMMLSSDLAFGEASDANRIAPLRATVAFTLQLGDVAGTLIGPDVTFYGGNYYNIIILDGNAFSAPTAIIAPTTLVQGLASAPSWYNDCSRCSNKPRSCRSNTTSS